MPVAAAPRRGPGPPGAPGDGGDGPVFDRGDGAAYYPDVVEQAFGRAVAAGVPDIGIHGLRHTCATLLLAGVHPKVVSERLGHASTAITTEVYTTSWRGCRS